MASVLATDQGVESEKSAVFHAVTSLLVAYVLVGGVLLAIGPRDYPVLHVVLDTGISLLAGVLAALLWVMGRHVGRPFLIWLATGFAVTSLLELIHVLAIVDWSGGVATASDPSSALRPVTWAPAAYILPIAVGGSIWLLRRQKANTLGFALVMVVAAGALPVIFQMLPSYTAPTFLGITRPVLILAPVLWLAIGILCWRWRETDRLLRRLIWMVPALLLADLVMLYSQAPDDTPAMVAHLGRVVGYLVLLLLLLKLASTEML